MKNHKPFIRHTARRITLVLCFLVTAAALYAQQPQTQLSDAQMLFKKAGILESQQLYKEAFVITEALLKAHPAGPGYRQAYIDQGLGAVRAELRNNHLTEARQYVRKILAADPGQHDALLYAISVAYAGGNGQEAADCCDSFLYYYPHDSLMLVKKADFLSQVNKHATAFTIVGSLLTRYPADNRLGDIYTDEGMVLGRQYLERKQTDSALAVYRQLLAVRPDNTEALGKVAGCYAELNKPDSVLLYAGRGLQQQPGNIALLREKAVALEKKGLYTEALAAAGEWKKQEPGNKRLDDYLITLKGKTWRNQLGVLHLQSFYDNGTRTALVSSLQYLRRFRKGVVLGRINYGNRQSGEALQLETEMYYNHSTGYYSWGWLGWSNSVVFPRYRASYSLFHNFRGGWEGELGFRYLRADTINTYTPVISAGKYIGNYWGNLRGYYTRDMNKWYQSYVFTNRFYLNDEKDFLAVLLGVGTSPDDRSRNFQLNQLLGVTTTSVTAGYQKCFRYKTTVSVYSTWNHMIITGKSDINQYDIYLSLYRNF